MIEEKREQAIADAIAKTERICEEFGEEFSSQIGDIDKEPERDRIFILEELLGKAQSQLNDSMLGYAQGMIEAIDEDELIRRKKANTRKGV